MRLLVVLALVSATATAEPKQPAKPEPLAVVFLIDRSSSMKGDRLDAAKEAAKAAATELHPDDTIGVIAFDKDAATYVVRQRAANRMRIAAGIDRILPGAGDDFIPAFGEAGNMLKDATARKKHVIVISDGGGTTDGLEAATKKLRKAGVTVTAVALDDRATLQIVAEHGEGRLYSVGDLGAVPKIAIKEIRALRK